MRRVEKILADQGIAKNFKFMVLEVTKQIEDTIRALENPNDKIIEKILARDDYIDNLKSVIENECFYGDLGRKLEKKELDVIRSVDIITSNLEKIADYAENVVSQIQYLENRDFINQFEYNAFFHEVLQGLGWVSKSLFKMDVSLALRICRTEFNLDRLFSENFKKVMEKLRSGENAENSVTALLILGYLERMGDALLNIGEAVIFAALGEKLKIHDFEALEDSMESYGMAGPLTEIAIESVWETKSGCKIKHVSERNGKREKKGAIYKEGRIKKIQKEKENIELWEKIFPGLPPRIYGFKENGKKAFILLECLKGITLQQLLLEPQKKSLEVPLESLKRTLLQIWKSTKKEQKAKAGFSKQLIGRIDDVLKVHPEFGSPSEQIGPLKTYSFSELIRIAEEIENDIEAPFAVFIHGDFNNDNIFFNKKERRVQFVDLYRSDYQDYAQDVSVFLVSCFRLPVFDSLIRDKLNYVTTDFFKFARDFSIQSGDDTFEARVGLGLARSFTTSTRFEFNKKFAADMFQRARYLLQKLAEHKGKAWSCFRIPEEILIY